MGLLLAKIIIAISKKIVGRLNMSRRKSKLSMPLPLENIIYVIRGNQSLFDNTWGPLCYLEMADGNSWKSTVCNPLYCENYFQNLYTIRFN